MIDGHDIKAILTAFSTARSVKDKPSILICKTYKGAGFPEIENEEDWHGKPLGLKSAAVLQHLEAKLRVGPAGDVADMKGKLVPPAPKDDCKPTKLIGCVALPTPPQYKLGDQVDTHSFVSLAFLLRGNDLKSLLTSISVQQSSKQNQFSYSDEYSLFAIINYFTLDKDDFPNYFFRISAVLYFTSVKVATRLAYGNALARLGETCDRVIALDGDTKNSTFSIKLMEAKPDQFIECFIAEQNMVGVGIGCAVRQRTIPFVSTFAAFLTRAFDQIRMGAVSQTNCNFAGSHAGVSIGKMICGVIKIDCSLISVF